MARQGRRDGAGTGDETRPARLERSAAPSGNPNPNPPSWRPATRDFVLTHHCASSRVVLLLDSQTDLPHLAP